VTQGRGRWGGEAGACRRCPARPHALALGLLAALSGAVEVLPADAAPAPAGAAATATDSTTLRSAAADAELAAACDDAAFLLAAGRAREALGRLEPLLRLAGPGHPQRERGLALVGAARTAETRENGRRDSAARLDSATGARQQADQLIASATSQRAERLARIHDLRARGHRELALAHLRALLHDLPGDDEVDGLFRELLDEAHATRSAAVAERERDLRAEVALLVERSLIPEGFDGRPMFPSDWSLRRSGRRTRHDVPDEAPAWQQAISDRLAGRVSVGFDGTPFTEAIEVVAKLGGVNILAAPDLLAATDRLITLRAVGMRLEDVLTWIAEQADTRWSLTNGAVFLGQAAQGTATTAIHDISEMLVGIGDFPGLHLDLSTGSAGAPAGFLAPADAGTPPATADDVADLIKRSVSPRLWAEEGNAIVVRGNALLVTAPADVQRLIREFLRAQSAQRSLSVRVDVRWLELYDSYVEEIGVQWTSGPTQMIDPGRRGGLVRRVEGWAVDGSTGNQLPGTAMSVQPATAGTGLTMQTSMLGNSQLSAVLSAVQRNAQGRVLQAPELTCLNGQQANAFFGTQVAYISDYEVVSGSYDPVISMMNLGVMIEVRPMVSADRKFVTLELRSATATATLFTESIVGVQNPSSSTLIIPSTTYPIELPNVAIRTAGTTAMLPDRGSLLVGGFKVSLDQFSSTRVPLLGSIPFLGRLFGARGRYAQKSQLYLLTTATIINYPELEARL
jgi:hypothetical protein